MKRERDNRISYIRKPLAKHSWWCLGTAIAGFILCIVGLALAVRAAGHAPVGTVSVCFSSLLFAALSLRWGWDGFHEEEINDIVLRWGTGIAGSVLIVWVVTLLAGIRA